MRVEQIKTFTPVKGFEVGYSPLGKPLMSAIFYYIDGLLIDTGPSNTRSSVDHMIKDIDIEQVVLTHYHEDHAGNAKFIKNHLKVPVFGHNKTQAILKKHMFLKPYEIFMWGKPEPVQIEVVPKIVETSKYQFIPIHTPGHSKDHLAYFEKNEGWLFSGDIFLGPKIKYFRRDEHVSQTIQSLDKLLKLDFDCLFCGHNPRLTRAVKMLKQKRDQLFGLYEEIKMLVEKGIPRHEVLKRFTKKRESLYVKFLTLGDVSYKNLIISTIDAVEISKKTGCFYKG